MLEVLFDVLITGAFVPIMQMTGRGFIAAVTFGRVSVSEDTATIIGIVIWILIIAVVVLFVLRK